MDCRWARVVMVVVVVVAVMTYHIAKDAPSSTMVEAVVEAAVAAMIHNMAIASAAASFA